MKITLLLTIAFAIQLQAATSFAQKTITLKEKNALLERVLEKIGQRTGYDIFFNADLMTKARPVSIDVKNMSLDDVLAKCFANQILTYTVKDTYILIKEKGSIPLVQGNKIRKLIDVSGQVLDERGQPLPGATIRVIGETGITSSDKDGKFLLKGIGENARLTVSFVGYATQDIALEGRTNITIKLAPINDLEEVVVTSQGNTQKKISVVGAIASITTKELKQSPVANLSNALAGRLPGLITTQTSTKPGDGSNLYIRGIATNGSSASPLYVIDGLPRSSGDFAQLDANEIESVSILKDASSTSAYGIQGANGVVVVTTRRGRANQKPEINFNAQYATQQTIRLPEMMDSYNLALYDNEAQQTEIWTKADFDIIRAGTDPYLYPNINWYDYLLKRATPQQQYNVNFTGGNDYAKYFISGSVTTQDALFKNEENNKYSSRSGFQRYNFRSNVDLKVTKMLDLSVDVSGRLEQRDGPGIGYDGLFSAIGRTLPNVTAPYNPNGSYAHGSKIFLPSDWQNPIAALISSGYYNEYRNVLTGAFTARHSLDMVTKGLSAQATFTFSNDNFKNTSRTQGYDDYWYKGLDAGGKPIYQQIRTASSLATSGSSSIERNNYLDIRLNYNRSFGNHQITGQILGNRTLRIFQDDLPYAYQGISGRATYGYDNKYFAEFTMGYNGSENFPKGKRYGFFPAFGAGWVVTNEKLIPKNNILSYLKIRGSYGTVGNDKVGGNRWLFISDYAANGGYSFGVNPAGQGGYSENRVGNPNVTWERAEKANLGFDAYLIKDFAKITFDIFRERRKNILLAAGTVPDYIGVSGLAPRNTGEVLNKGFETELVLTKKFGEFYISATGQVTYASNKVINNDQPTPAYPYQDLKGYAVGYQLGYKAIGIFNSQDEINNSPIQRFSATLPGDIKYLDVNKDGQIDAADRVPITLLNVPKYVWGASLRLGYKGFDFSFLLNGASGSNTYVGSTNPDFVLRGRSIWEDRWSPNNMDNPTLPSARRASNNNQISSFWSMNTSYLKLRNAEIGYEFPKRWVNGIKLNYLRIFVNGQNLYVWDNMWIKESDPESAGTITSYPATRTINAGISLRF
ncbi:TonB-dependent receptor [Pedobacter rhodius]|uniref:TonB-dependent receptor n=1 Tax=Pedobacter rhodius TaxID=3004098 RepID=A0ABT4KWF1_9SPHI|nr:TonB-dependent receptor [Pedobacter sp. SJ11]MCZ4223263.1 TonB-dependent receptor [Pedobacter sp. SJ11]